MSFAPCFFAATKSDYEHIDFTRLYWDHGFCYEWGAYGSRKATRFIWGHVYWGGYRHRWGNYARFAHRGYAGYLAEYAHLPLFDSRSHSGSHAFQKGVGQMAPYAFYF